MNEDQLKKSISSRSTRARNPHLFGPAGGLGGQDPQPVAAPPLVRRVPKQKCSGRPLVEVCIIAFRRGEVDDDSLPMCSKPLRDIIAATLNVDDADKRVRWRYAQCLTQGAPHTLVIINIL